MKLKSLSLIFALVFGMFEASAADVKKTPAQAVAEVTLDPSVLLPMVCTAITSLAKVPSGCTTACAHPTAPNWNDLSCCVGAAAPLLNASKSTSIQAAVTAAKAFCLSCSLESIHNACSCTASPCSDSAKYYTNTCAAICCNSGYGNADPCLADYLPDDKLSCATTFPCPPPAGKMGVQ
jgi:hypothetical protein